MPSPTENLRFCAILATGILLSQQIGNAQDAGAAPSDAVAPTIIVRASASDNSAAQFLSGFISTAIRLNGQNLASCVATAVRLRPDLASRIVVCALNIARINAQSITGRLSLDTINQIIKAAVAAAPSVASAIVTAAIESEPYARDSIIAAAVSAAPDQESGIRVAVASSSSISTIPALVAFNPSEAGPSGSVNSPEQPPSGP
jgi:hypothetical protein